VVLAAELQRATVMRRLERLRGNPARRVLGLAAWRRGAPRSSPLERRPAKLALRLWRRRSARRLTHH
jgi:hypothetical protein